MCIFSDLPNLCTFTKTGRSYDHEDDYYECKTCDMAMCKFCTLCITICHADHDVKYIRNGRHFCDCGAEGEKTCENLVRKQTGKLFTFSELINFMNWAWLTK